MLNAAITAWIVNSKARVSNRFGHKQAEYCCCGNCALIANLLFCFVIGKIPI